MARRYSPKLRKYVGMAPECYSPAFLLVPRDVNVHTKSCVVSGNVVALRCPCCCCADNIILFFLVEDDDDKISYYYYGLLLVGVGDSSCIIY